MRWQDAVMEVATAPHAVDAFRAVVEYILFVYEDVELERVAETLGTTAGQDAKEQVVTTGQQLVEQGRQEGHREGLVEGQRGLVLRQLEARFGPLPDDAAARVADADSGTLARWAERLLTASELDDVFAD